MHLMYSICIFFIHFFRLRVEFLLKTDSGYPKDTGVNKPWQPLGIPFAITPIYSSEWNRISKSVYRRDSLWVFFEPRTLGTITAFGREAAGREGLHSLVFFHNNLCKRAVCILWFVSVISFDCCGLYSPLCFIPFSSACALAGGSSSNCSVDRRTHACK